MKTLLKAVAALSLAVSGVSVANAQNFPAPFSDPEGGALIVSIWDSVANASLVYAIPNTFYQELRDGSFTSFVGAVPEYASIFGASDPANINYTVLAAGSFSPGFPNTPQPALFATGPASLPNVINTNVQGSANNVNVFYGQLNADANCTTAAPCTSTNPTDGIFAANLGDLSNQLPFSAAGLVGQSLAFYDIAQTGQPGPAAAVPADVPGRC